MNKKENPIMDICKAKVIVGNKIYAARSVDWTQTPFEYPEVQVNVTLSPDHLIGVYDPRSHNILNNLTITNVIYNPPATIVFWSDKTKTVVKADSEEYDPEKGLAMAISRKMLGDNKYEYYHTFKHWLKKWNKQNRQSSNKPDNQTFNPTEMYL